MTVENTPDRVTQRDLYEAINAARVESKADLSAAEARLTSAISILGDRFTGFVTTHAREHDVMEAQIDSAARISTLREGQTTGILGAITFLGRNWQLIALVIFGVMALTGQLNVSFSGH